MRPGCGSPGRFEVPDWDKVTLDRIRGALSTLGEYGGLGKGFGRKGEVDPFGKHVVWLEGRQGSLMDRISIRVPGAVSSGINRHDHMAALVVGRQPRVECHDASFVVPSQRHQVGVHHLLMAGGMLEATDVQGGQRLPIPVTRMGRQLGEQGDGVLRSDRID